MRPVPAGPACFEADIDLAASTNKCNCSICTKARNWNVIVRPEAFRLLAGEDAQTGYAFSRKAMRHLFCRTFGVHTFGRGYVEEIGGHYVAAQLASLDTMDPAELAQAHVRYADGRQDNWHQPPRETRHL